MDIHHFQLKFSVLNPNILSLRKSVATFHKINQHLETHFPSSGSHVQDLEENFICNID